MRNYEILCIIKPNLDMDESNKAVDVIETSLKNLGGKVNNIDKIGRKKLAYEIKDFKDGFYADLKIELPEDKVVELKRILTLNDNIIRFMLLESSKVRA